MPPPSAMFSRVIFFTVQLVQHVSLGLLIVALSYAAGLMTYYELH